MLINYGKVYNQYYYLDRSDKGLVVITNKLVNKINEVHNILDINEISKITDYKIEPIFK